MTDLTFRTCQRQDLLVVQELVDALYFRHGLGCDADIALTYEEFRRRPDKGRIIVIDREGVVAGYAIVIFFWSNEYRGNIIEIDELLVDAQLRGQGIATRFFGWLEDEYRERCSGLSLQVAKSNPKARRLYERLGFKPSANEHLLKLLNSNERSQAALLQNDRQSSRASHSIGAD